MSYKLTTLTIAKRQIEKELAQAEKVVTKHSNRLGTVDMSETTLKGRAQMRINLDVACEARDIIQRQLDFTKDWMKEIKESDKVEEK